mmetsp:Transcript_13832/g.43280  ORF Transcript_13832/g.43280 Transcript_13832/m.43280 type:complete len:274 (-) Transcript_13832:154-975(-)
MPLATRKFTPAGAYLNCISRAMKFVFQSPGLRVACQEIMQTSSGCPPRATWCRSALKRATSVSSSSASLTAFCRVSFERTKDAPVLTIILSIRSSCLLSCVMWPLIFLAFQPSPQAGTLTVSLSSLKFFAVVTASAPARPSFARRFVAFRGSQTQPRLAQTSFSDHASILPELQHRAPCQLQRRSGTGAWSSLPSPMEGPQSSPSPCLCTGAKPPCVSCCSSCSAWLESRDDAHLLSAACIWWPVQRSARSTGTPAHSASMLLRMGSPCSAGS